jgi:AraC-like DNA-binding protein
MYVEMPPPSVLRDVVRCSWELLSEGNPQRVLPDGCTALLFSWRAGSDVVAAQVVGAMTRAVVTPSATPGQLLGIRLQPWAARTVLDVPADELRDRAVDLESVWGAEGRRLRERLANARCRDERLRVVEAQLVRRMARARYAAPASVLAAVGNLLASGGAGSIRALATQVGAGERFLERAFEAHVGLSPKGLARICRLQAAVRALDSNADAELAASAGYADQSHLIREFRALSGLTPRQLAAERLSDSSNPFLA